MSVPGAPARLVPLAALASCLLLAIVVYLPGLPGEFVYDDHRLIVNNDGLKRPFDPSRAFLRDYYASDFDRTHLGYYRPLAILSNEIDYRRGGGGALPFHVTNIAIHVAATGLVFALARRLAGGGLAAPVVAGALFAVHPAHAESVAFISGRVDPLATVFVLATVLLHLRANVSPRPHRWRVAAASVWLLGLLSKEMAVTAPILAAVLELGLEGLPARRSIAARGLRYVPFAAAAASYLIARRIGLGLLLAASPEGAKFSLSAPFVAMGTYLRWLAFPPFGLNLEPEPSGGSWAVLAGTGILGAVSIGVLLWRRGFRVELAALADAALALVPVLQLKPIETALSERFLYLPSAFAMTLAGLVAARTVSRRGRATYLALVVVLGATYAAVLVPRARLWRDEVQLWNAKEREDHGSLKAQLNLGRAWHSRGDDSAARAAYERAIAIAPSLAAQIRAEMSTLVGEQTVGDSIADLRHAIEASPGDGSLWGNLGFLLYARGELQDAAVAFAKAKELTPLRATNWLGSALVKRQQNDYAGAEEDATRAAILDPTLGIARVLQSECLLRREKPCEALAALEGVRLDDPRRRESLEALRAEAKAACGSPR